SASPSLATLTESATSATVPVGSIARFTGGPTTEFFSGRLATIFGFIGSARSTISTESLPTGDSTGFPLPSRRDLPPFPPAENGPHPQPLSRNGRGANSPAVRGSPGRTVPATTPGGRAACRRGA